MHHFERDLFADQPAQQHGEIRQRLAEVEHLRAQRLAAREGEQLAHQARRPVGVLLDLHDVLERRIGRPMRIEQEVGRHHDGGEHVVEIVRDPAGELAHRLHLLRLGELRLERPLLGHLHRIDDRHLAVALALLDRRHVEARRAAAGAGERRIDRGDVALPVGRLGDRALEPAAVALGNGGEDRATLGGNRIALEHALEQPGERRVGARDPPGLVDRRDRHRRIVEEAHEPHFGGAQRVGGLLARPVEHERARSSGDAVGREGDLVVEARPARSCRRAS